MKLTRRNNGKNDGNHLHRWITDGLGLPDTFDDFITRDLFRPSFNSTGVSTPAVNIIETAEDFRLEMVAPGMKKENFHLEIEQDVLTISYDHEDNREGERPGWKYVNKEYNYHSFVRNFSLPDTVVPDKIDARYEDGILNVTIPKSEGAKGKPSRQIPIT